MANTVQKFLLNELDVRGVIVHLDSAWQTVLARRHYPAPLVDLLGQATAATLLMSANIKFEGQLMLQLQSQKLLSLLVVQNTHDNHFRALARYSGYGNALSSTLTEVAEGGLIAIVIEADQGKEPYQGIVSIDSDSLASNVETYFNQSEQLKTLLVLRADEQQVAGILLQALPNSAVDDDNWIRLRHLAETLNLDEMQHVNSETMITRLFAEDDKTVYPAESAEFECACSDERTLVMLANLDNEELQEIVDAEESVSVSCDFCGQKYDHDAPTIAALLSHKRHPN